MFCVSCLPYRTCVIRMTRSRVSLAARPNHDVHAKKRRRGEHPNAQSCSVLSSECEPEPSVWSEGQRREHRLQGGPDGCPGDWGDGGRCCFIHAASAAEQTPPSSTSSWIRPSSPSLPSSPHNIFLGQHNRRSEVRCGAGAYPVQCP